MKKHLLYILAAIVMALVIASCKKDSIVPPDDFGTDYYPLKFGDYRVYDVDSIHFNDVTLTSDTFHFQIREEVDSVVWIEDGTDFSTTWYELKIYRRADTTQLWQQTHYANAGVSKVRAERIEGNLHFIKLVFPVTQNKTWLGNTYMSDSSGSMYAKDWEYYYSNVDTTINYLTKSFDSCIVVSQYDSQNLIEKDIEQEVYSKGIGLVYKNSTHVERQDITNPIWIPEKGTIVTYRLREHN